MRLPGNPIKMSGMDHTISNPGPRVGEHTDALLGLSAETITDLRLRGAVK